MASLWRRAFSREAADAPPAGSGGARSVYAGGAAPGTDIAGTVIDSGPTRVATAVTVINFLSDELGSLPCHVVERGDRTRAPIMDQRYRYLWGDPNSDSDAVPWWQQLWAHLEGWSNAFVYRRMVSGRTVGLDLLHPSRVRVERRDSGERLYHYAPGGGRRVTYRRGEVVHIMRRSWDGIRGVPPISASVAAHRISTLQDRWQMSHYLRSARPSGVVASPSEWDDDAVDEFYEAWDEQIAAPSGGQGVLLLQGAATYHPILPASDEGLLRARAYTREEIVGAYAPGIPHHLLGWRSNTSNFGTGIEAQGLHLLLHVFEPRLRLVARTLAAHLLPKALTLDWHTEEWLRADAKAKAEVYAKLRLAGIVSREEVRGRFSLGAAPVVDDFWQPTNMQRVES